MMHTGKKKKRGLVLWGELREGGREREKKKTGRALTHLAGQLWPGAIDQSVGPAKLFFSFFQKMFFDWHY